MDWSLKEVLEWLKLIKLEDEYINIIKDHKIDGKMLINLNHSELLFNLGIKPYGVRYYLLHEIKKLASSNIETVLCKRSPNNKIIEGTNLDEDKKNFISNGIDISNSSDTVVNTIQDNNINTTRTTLNNGMIEEKVKSEKISYMHELDPIKWSLNSSQNFNIKNSRVYNTWDLNLDKLKEINKFRDRLNTNKGNSSENCVFISANLIRKLLLNHIKEHYLTWRESALKNGAPKLETSKTRRGGFILELINRLNAGLSSMLDDIMESGYTSESEMNLDLLKLDTYLNQVYLYTMILDNYSLNSINGVNIQKLNQISKLLNTSIKKETSKYSKFYTNALFNNKIKAPKNASIKQLAIDLITCNIEDIKKFHHGEESEINVNLKLFNCEFREANGFMSHNSIYNSSSYSEEPSDTLSSPQSNYIVISSDIYSDTFTEPEVIILSD